MEVQSNLKKIQELYKEYKINKKNIDDNWISFFDDLTEEAADLLEENNITVNKNGIPNDPRSFIETSGIRIGTAAETTRGHGADWFRDLAKKIVELIK